MEDPDGMRSAARRSDSGDLFRHCHLEEDDDDYEEEDEEDSERAMEHDGSDGWQTAEEDSDDEEQKWGGSTDGRNVESRRVSGCHASVHHRPRHPLQQEVHGI